MLIILITIHVDYKDTKKFGRLLSLDPEYYIYFSPVISFGKSDLIIIEYKKL